MVGRIGEVLVRGIGRLRELLGRLAVEHRAHEAAEDVVRTRAGRDGHLVAGIAEPNGGGQLRRDAAERDVLVAFARTRLRRDHLAVRQSGLLSGALGGVHHALHDLGGRVGDFRRYDLFAMRLRKRGVGRGVVDDHLALRVGDGEDGRWINAHAAVRNDSVGAGHVEHRDVRLAQRERRVRAERGGDAHVLGDLDHLVDAHGHLKANEARVGRHGERALNGTGAVVVVVDVLQRRDGGAVLGIGNSGRRRAVHHRLRADARFERCDEREHLERGAGRTARIGNAALARGQVQLLSSPLVVLAAHHGLDVARFGLDGHKRTVDRRIETLPLLLDGGLGGLLGVDVQRGLDGQAAFEQLIVGITIVAVGIHEQVAHVAAEVRILLQAIHRGLGRVEHDALRLGGIVLFLGDVAVRQHAIQHEVATREAVVLMVDGIVVRRRLRNADERGRFGQRELACMLREVALRRGFDAVGAGTVVDGIEVHEQDFVFGVLFLQLDGEIHLAHLALERDIVHLVGQDSVAHELLRDGGRALLAGTGEVHVHRARDAREVETAVFVEALVLGGHGALAHVLADLVELDGVAVLDLEAGELRTVRRQHDRRQRRVELAGIGHVVVLKVADPRRTEGVDA